VSLDLLIGGAAARFTSLSPFPAASPPPKPKAKAPAKPKAKAPAKPKAKAPAKPKAKAPAKPKAKAPAKPKAKAPAKPKAKKPAKPKAKAPPAKVHDLSLLRLHTMSLKAVANRIKALSNPIKLRDFAEVLREKSAELVAEGDADAGFECGRLADEAEAKLAAEGATRGAPPQR
jgi:hypothetical protein